jgi:adenine-specific DNA-methyltransferase
MDYIETVSIERLKKVIGKNEKPKDELLEKIIYDEGGISKAVNWQGGGDFVYCELKKYNQTFIEQIEEAKDSKKLLKIWEEMKEHSFINYNVDIKKQDDEIEDFKELTLQQQKEILLQILNKNQLYVNLSSIDDEDFKVSEEDKKLTKEFYEIAEEQNSIQTETGL